MNERLKNMKISKKLSTIFGIVLTCFIMALIIAISSLWNVGGKLNTFYETSYRSVTSSVRMQKGMQEAAKNILWSMTTSDPQDTQDRLDSAQEALAGLHENLEVLKETYRGDTGDLETFDTEMLKTAEVKEEMFELIKQNKNEEALVLYDTVYVPHMREASEALIRVSTGANTRATANYESANRAKALSIIISAVIAVCSTLLALFCCKMVIASLTKPIKEIEAAAKEMAMGSLSVKVTYESEDELGSLSESMRILLNGIGRIVQDISHYLSTMAKGDFTVKSEKEENYIADYKPILENMEVIADHLSKVIEEIKETASQVALGSANMAEGAQALAGGAADQSSAVEELTATINEVTERVEQTAAGAGEAYQKAKQVSREISVSNGHMTRMTDAMGRINETSSQIENIIKSIEDIATQTNLLSLNAAIEAARAGEAGKGFAVVADEIRQLADQSAKAASNTRDLIRSSVDEINNGSSIVNDTSESLNQVVTTIDEMSNIIEEARNSTEQQAQSMEEINKGIEQIADVVESNSATAQESSASSEELSAQADVLNSLVGQFVTR